METLFTNPCVNNNWCRTATTERLHCHWPSSSRFLKTVGSGQLSTLKTISKLFKNVSTKSSITFKNCINWIELNLSILQNVPTGMYNILDDNKHWITDDGKYYWSRTSQYICLRVKISQPYNVPNSNMYFFPLGQNDIYIKFTHGSVHRKLD